MLATLLAIHVGFTAVIVAALVLYALAYLVFVTLLRFADCFQHTYDAYPILDDAPIPDDKVRDKVAPLIAANYRGGYGAAVGYLTGAAGGVALER